jgi:hypothetical protein
MYRYGCEARFSRPVSKNDAIHNATKPTHRRRPSANAPTYPPADHEQGRRLKKMMNSAASATFTLAIAAEANP